MNSNSTSTRKMKRIWHRLLLATLMFLGLDSVVHASKPDAAPIDRVGEIRQRLLDADAINMRDQAGRDTTQGEDEGEVAQWLNWPNFWNNWNNWGNWPNWMNWRNF